MSGGHVDTPEQAAEFLRWLGERRPVLAVDTESGGLEWWRQPLRLVQFGDAETAWSLSYRNWRGVIDTALRRYDDRPITFANANYDKHVLERNGLPTPALHLTHDAITMDRLAHPEAPHHGVKDIGARLFGSGAKDEQDALKEAFDTYGWDWATVPEDFPVYQEYARKDTILEAREAEQLARDIAAQGLTRAYEREMVAAEVMYRAERRGMRIDVEYTKNLRAQFAGQMQAIRDKVPEFDITQAAALQGILQLDGWEPSEFTPTGKVKFTAEIREQLNDTFARLHTKYKRLEKWDAAYLSHFLSELDDGRVHATIATLRAITGRMAVSKPALHQLPRGDVIRNCVLPYEGERLWNVDYRAMEMVAFSELSQDPALVAACRAGLDFHKFTASMVYDIGIETVSAWQRQTAKSSVSFGKIFGAGKPAVARQAKVSIAEVERFSEVYDAKFPGVAQYMADVVRTGRQRERTEGVPYVTTFGGRRVPQTDGRTYALVNYAVQGGCADLFKDKIIQLDAAGYGDWVVLPVHDSLLFSVPPECEDEMPKVAEIMEEHERFSVPFTVDVAGPLERWGDEKK